ncbi:MAG: peptidoglycan editing factor PgeF [Sulfurimonas sp.]|nr:peptidoglycan editing factor PgeF [Sulfurimonas sp.]MDQ7059781.1 peptidoglycan editing factor PgeF [Sulfurimonas sp.]
MQFYHSNLLNSVINVTHVFTTKESGNLAFHINETPLAVMDNHKKLAKELGYEKKSLIHMKQFHSSLVHIVTDADNFTNPKECDALITNKKNTPLMVMVADCSPVLFYDPFQEVIAVAHAGRQGTFKNIVKNTIESMHSNFNSKSENISVVIGASIGECCYEVGEEIYKEASSLSLEYAFRKKGEKYHLNISKILLAQLLASGIKEEHIDISKECTCCLSETYYSYRAESITGRFAGVILLKNSI